MSLFFITGIAGTGKTTVLTDLKARGYEVHDADEKLSSWENKQTRERVPSSDHRLTTDEKFFEEHDWYIDREGVKRLSEAAANKTIFLCGSVANEDEVWAYFDKVFCLFVDNKTLVERIKQRTDKDFGKSEHELAHLIRLNNEVLNKYESLGATVIDATKSVKEVTNQIISLCGL